MAAAAPERSCTLFREDPEEACPTANRSEAKRIRELIEKRKMAEAQAILFGEARSPGRLCATCRLFGSPFAASKLKFFDLPQRGAAAMPLVRHGVGIDRDEGRAKENILYDYEVLERGTEGRVFDLRVLGENLNEMNPDFALLGILWTMAAKELTVGAKSGAGLGSCRIELERVQYFDDRSEHKLRNFLLAKDDDRYAKMAPADFLALLSREKKGFLEAQDAARPAE